MSQQTAATPTTAALTTVVRTAHAGARSGPWPGGPDVLASARGRWVGTIAREVATARRAMGPGQERQAIVTGLADGMTTS